MAKAVPNSCAINQSDHLGNTAAHYAAQRNQIAILNELVHLPTFRLVKPNKVGQEAIDVAGNAQTVACLRLAGAELGRTPVVLDAGDGFSDLEEILQDLELKSRFEQNPLPYHRILLERTMHPYNGAEPRGIAKQVASSTLKSTILTFLFKHVPYKAARELSALDASLCYHLAAQKILSEPYFTKQRKLKLQQETYLKARISALDYVYDNLKSNFGMRQRLMNLISPSKLTLLALLLFAICSYAMYYYNRRWDKKVKEHKAQCDRDRYCFERNESGEAGLAVSVIFFGLLACLLLSYLLVLLIGHQFVPAIFPSLIKDKKLKCILENLPELIAKDSEFISELSLLEDCFRRYKKTGAIGGKISLNAFFANIDTIKRLYQTELNELRAISNVTEVTDRFSEFDPTGEHPLGDAQGPNEVAEVNAESGEGDIDDEGLDLRLNRLERGQLSESSSDDEAGPSEETPLISSQYVSYRT